MPKPPPREPQAGVPSVLTASAVARQLGVAVDTLRTWDRRYGIGPSGRPTGKSRRYTPDDVDRLHRMRALVADGMSAADAATTVIAPDRLEAGRAASSKAAPGRLGGGRTLAIPGGAPEHRGLARAATALDADTVERLLSESMDLYGAVITWDELLRPVLVAAGRRWETNGDAVEVEHLLSQTAGDVFRQAARRQSLRTRVPVLAASVEDDTHTLPLYALAAALREVGVAVHVLGASTPSRALQAAARRLGPSGIFVWSQLPGRAVSPNDLAGLVRSRPLRRVVVGGPGWDPDALPQRVQLAESLDQAVALLTPWGSVTAA